MKKLLPIIALVSMTAEANVGKYVAAVNAANLEVCANRLSDTKGYKLKSFAMKLKAKKINGDNVGKKNYIKALVASKSKARKFPLRKCKNILDRN